jgi:hypothetical protein
VATIQIRRSRQTFLLLVADEDNGRFAIEGPMKDDQPWVHEILKAQKAGRRLTCWAINQDSAGVAAAAQQWEEMTGRAWWPQGSIVSPEANVGSPMRESVAD